MSFIKTSASSTVWKTCGVTPPAWNGNPRSPRAELEHRHFARAPSEHARPRCSSVQFALSRAARGAAAEQRVELRSAHRLKVYVPKRRTKQTLAGGSGSPGQQRTITAIFLARLMAKFSVRPALMLPSPEMARANSPRSPLVSRPVIPLRK
jgi:hypothetical protein